jgi:hypothetical protein
VIDGHSLPELYCSIVAGGANNVLAESHHGEALSEHHPCQEIDLFDLLLLGDSAEFVLQGNSDLCLSSSGT